MASGSFNTNSWDGRYLQFNWSSTKNDAANTSTVTWEVRSRGGSVNWYITSNVKVIIDGVQRYFKAAGVQAWKDGVLASGTVTISHSNDGSRQFSASVEAGVYYSAPNVSGSGSWWLDQIPRATQPSISPASQTMGASITISMPRASSSFTHTVKYSFGTKSGTIVSKLNGTSTTWTIPRSLATEIPNATSGWGQITVDTYSGNTLIGSKSVQFTANVHPSDKPTFSTMISQSTSDVSNAFGKYMTVLSTVSVTISPLGIYGSTIRSQNISLSVNGSTVATTTGTVLTHTPTVEGTYKYTASVTDSRGRTTTSSGTFAVYEYSPPVASLQAYRTDTAGTAQEDGTCITVEYSVLHTAGTNNPLTATLKIYSSDGGEVINEAISGTGKKTYTNGFSEDNDYTIIINLSDRFRQSSTTVKVMSTFSLIDFSKGGTGIAFGKSAQTENLFNCGMNAMFDGFTTFNKQIFAPNIGIAVQDDVREDLNWFMDGGIYYIAGTPTNRPESGQGFLIVLAREAGTVVQMWVGIAPSMYLRRYSSGMWRPWIRLQPMA